MTQKLVARHGCVVRPRVERSVFLRLAAEAKKTPRMTVDRVAAQILTWWDEDCAREDAEKERAARAALMLQVRGRG